jgi:hypothetical protein
MVPSVQLNYYYSAFVRQTVSYYYYFYDSDDAYSCHFYCLVVVSVSEDDAADAAAVRTRPTLRHFAIAILPPFAYVAEEDCLSSSFSLYRQIIVTTPTQNLE